jgi:porphobilinogen deaminase
VLARVQDAHVSIVAVVAHPDGSAAARAEAAASPEDPDRAIGEVLAQLEAQAVSKILASCG